MPNLDLQEKAFHRLLHDLSMLGEVLLVKTMV